MAQTTALLIAPPAWGKTRILEQLIQNAPTEVLARSRLLEKHPDRHDLYRGGCIVRLEGPNAQELFSAIQHAACILGLAWDQLHVDRSAITAHALKASYQRHPPKPAPRLFLRSKAD